jgi:hypothetical protein
MPFAAFFNRENDSDENTSDVLMWRTPHLLSITYVRVIGGQNGLQHYVNNLECARGNAMSLKYEVRTERLRPVIGDNHICRPH